MINSLEAEQSVLGAVLIEPKLMPGIINLLSKDDFYREQHQKIFGIMAEKFLKNRPIDIITVMETARHEGIFQTDENAKIYLTQLAQIVPSTANIMAYAEIVRDKSRRRKALELAAKSALELENDVPLDECLGTVCDLNKVLNTVDKNSELTPLEGFTQVYMSLDKPKNYIKTGFENLDKYTKIDKGDYVVVAGRPSTGKTALTLQIMLAMARTKRVVYFSLETGTTKIYERLMSAFTRTPFGDIKSGNIKNYVPIAEKSDSFCKLNFIVVKAAGWTTQQIKAKAILEKADVIFIDYLGLVRGKGKDRYEIATNISIDLHIMAQTSNIAVVALSQLNRAGKGEKPDMSNLRESGQIEQDADVILMLSLENENNPKSDRQLKIAKNKEGITGNLLLAFDGQYQTFREIYGRDCL